MTTSPSPWQLARRAARMTPSVIRERLKRTKKPGIISFAGGLPSRKTFPVADSEAACAMTRPVPGNTPPAKATARCAKRWPTGCPGTSTPFAVQHGEAFVPGAPFYADQGDARTLRLSFVTPSVKEIHRGVAALAAAIRQQQGQ